MKFGEYSQDTQILISVSVSVFNESCRRRKKSKAIVDLCLSLAIEREIVKHDYTKRSTLAIET